MVGETFAGRYELEEVLGAGGMSTVYKARDSQLERHVAIKILHDHYAADAEYLERFRREARAVARLSHPNIVTVIDRGEDAGRQFIVFEYVEGQTLKDLVTAGRPLPVRDALALGLQVARALAFAHTHGIVHRDVKPQNVLLNGDGKAKVTDFGIARSLDVEGVTQSGTVLGTSNYIAPEQASGEPVDPRTDVYSLGVVLFEALSGRVPFPGESFVAVALKHVHEEPPNVLDLRRDVPPRVAAAVDRALRKDPAERFPSMEAFAAELEACLLQLDGRDDGERTLVSHRALPLRRRGRRRLRSFVPALLIVLGLSLLAAAIAALLLTRPSPQPASNAKPPAKGGAAVRLTGVGSFDPPPGDGREHDDRVAEATDRNPATYWTTEHYSGFTKPGVGLVLDAGEPVALKRVEIVTDTPGFTAAIMSGNSRTGPFTGAASARAAAGTTRFAVSAKPGRYYVVWITNPGPQGVAHVNEVRARR